MLFNAIDTIVKYTGELPENSHHQFCRNVYSQNGEDGLLDQLLNELGIQTSTFCEFGASDGINSSNTRNLIEQRGFTGLYIEGNPHVFPALVKIQVILQVLNVDRDLFVIRTIIKIFG